MHRADQRHGLDVVASLRADGHGDAGPAARGTLPRRRQGTERRPAGRASGGRSASTTERGSSAQPRWLPGFRDAFERLRDHAERSAEMALAAGCIAGDRGADPPPGATRSIRSPVRRSAWPTRPTDASAARSSRRRGAAAVEPLAPDRRERPDLRPVGAPGSRRAGPARRSFEGPLALLLSLIEQRQLDVLTVPLGDLCGAYLDALCDAAGRARCPTSARSSRLRAADPDQEPRACCRGSPPLRWARTTASTLRRRCASGCCSTGATGTPPSHWVPGSRAG